MQKLNGKTLWMHVPLLGVLVAGVMAAQDVPAKEPKARVVVYRVGRFSSKKIKASIYCDDREVAYLANGRFLTLSLSPGKHRIISNDEKTSVSLDAKSGGTYYVRVSLGGGAWVRIWFGVEDVDSATALKQLAGLKPADTKHVLAPEIVSTKPLPGQ
jgi:hypothetical protein